MKIVRVVAAVIESDHKIFATQRGYGEFKGGWEFPGGKIEPGETPQQALVRGLLLVQNRKGKSGFAGSGSFKMAGKGRAIFCRVAAGRRRFD